MSGSRVCVHLGVRFRSITNSKDGIDVNISDECVETTEPSEASLGGVSHIGTRKIALKAQQFISHFVAVKGVPVCHFNIGTVGVVVPVGATVSNGKAFEVRLKYILVVSVGNVILVNLPSQIGDINTGI